MMDKELIINEKDLRAYYHSNHTIYAVGSYMMRPQREEYPLGWILYVYNGIISKEDMLDDRLRLNNVRIGTIFYQIIEEVHPSYQESSIFFFNKLNELKIEPNPNMDMEKRIDIECEMIDELVIKDFDTNLLMEMINTNREIIEKEEENFKETGVRNFTRDYKIVQNDIYKGHVLYYNGKTIVTSLHSNYGQFPDTASADVYNGILSIGYLEELSLAENRKIGGFGFSFGGYVEKFEDDVYYNMRKKELPDFMSSWEKMFQIECEMVDKYFYLSYKKAQNNG